MEKSRNIHQIDFDNTILPMLGLTVHVIDMYVGDKLKESEFDLTKVQMLLLLRLSRNDGQPQQDLAFITQRDKASLTRLLDTMERKNLVARIPSKSDKRINHIHLTKHGWDVANEVRPIMNSIMDEVQRDLNKTEVKSMIEVLKKIQTNINYREIVAYQTK